MPEVMGGWARICREPATGTVRTLKFWRDLAGTTRIAAGSNARLYLCVNPNTITDTLLEITPNGFVPGHISSPVGSPYTLLIWSLDNFGQLLFACPSGGKIYQWTPGTPAAIPLVGAPAVNQGFFIESQRRIVVAYGCTPVTGGAADPLTIRWCDQGDPNTWNPLPTNQAGSFRLPVGNRIVGGLSMPNVSLIWTDQDLWSMNYIGFPEVYSFTRIGQQCGLLAQNGATLGAGIPFWWSDHGFFTLGGSGVTQLPCPVWDKVFKDLDTNNFDKCFIGTNFHYSEVYFYYPSLSGVTGEIDSYVKVNTQEGEWDWSGNGGPGVPTIMARTAWTDQNQPGDPVSAGLDGTLLQAEQGYTQDGVGFIPAVFQTGFQDILDGDAIWTVDQFMPDFLWAGPDPSLDLTILFRHFPGDPTTSLGPFRVTPQSGRLNLNLPLQRTYTDPQGIQTHYTTWGSPRGREIAFKIENKSGWFRWGAPRITAYRSGSL